MKVLVVGGGGREHAIVWKLAQGKPPPTLYCAPGNGGICELAREVPIAPQEVDRLLSFAKEEGIELTIVGPEIPLFLGLVDRFQGAGLKVFGPRREAARIETSKAFCKELLLQQGIPTAGARVAEGLDAARRALQSRSFPVVIKADGLAAGKGVVVARSQAEALRGLDELEGLGEASQTILIEDFLEGEEMSFLVLTDGEQALPIGTARDHKRLLDADRGPNTGGMGALSPSPQISESLQEQILRQVILPTLRGIAAKAVPYQGVLYAGLMLTKEGPKVLEFNARFGDPETQAILFRLDSNLLEVLDQVAHGGLPRLLQWRPSSWTVCVVAAAKGYPEGYANGAQISGLDDAAALENLVVFHAGTRREGKQFFTAGGRVLGVTGRGPSIGEARKAAYGGIGRIRFDGMQFRTDIGIRGA